MTSNDNNKIITNKFEVIKNMESFVADNIDKLLKPVNESWQPSDYLPDMNAENWREQINEFRQKAEALSDELLVVLIGDMITEEALPTYQTYLNRLEGLTDFTGVSNSPWARWSRGWTAEENRHGDLLNKYLFLTGRTDMHAVEITIQNLIKNGFNPQTENDPYLGFIFTSFQERATKISHTNVARLAIKAGDNNLQKICGLIAGDEARHEKAYRLFMQKIFEVDPVQAILAFAKMMKTKITMPSQLMTDGKSNNLFTNFSNVAQKIKVYTVKDYADIIANLVSGWNVENIIGLSDIAAKAQDYICNLSERYLKIANRLSFAGTTEKFSWLFNRKV